MNNITQAMTKWKHSVIISAKCERSDHWRRLWDWSFCVSVILSSTRFDRETQRWHPPV